MKTEGQRIKQDSLLPLGQVVTFLFYVVPHSPCIQVVALVLFLPCPVGGIHLVSLK